MANGALSNVGSLEVQPSSGTGVISIKDAGTGTNSGGLICINDANGDTQVCAISGGILDCNDFSAKSTLCP